MVSVGTVGLFFWDETVPRDLPHCSEHSFTEASLARDRAFDERLALCPSFFEWSD
jgi:hypothetical protein